MNQDTSTRIKLGVLVALLLALASVAIFFLWTLIGISEASHHHHFKGIPLPILTQLCVDYRPALLFLPFPWLFAGVWLVHRRDASAFSLTAFSSTLLMTLLAAAIVIGVALTIAWLPMKIVSMHH